jgi:hypothetical protein
MESVYPVMEDEGKRQNENELLRKKERGDSKRIVRKNDHFHTSLVKHHNQLLNSVDPELHLWISADEAFPWCYGPCKIIPASQKLTTGPYAEPAEFMSFTT